MLLTKKTIFLFMKTALNLFLFFYIMRDFSEILQTNTEKVLSVNENNAISEKLKNRIENVRTIAGVDKGVASPFAASYPSLVSMEPLKNSEDYIMGLNGTITGAGSANRNPVVNYFGPANALLYYLVFKIFPTKFAGHEWGYTFFRSNFANGTFANLDNFEIYAAACSYFNSISMTFEIKITAASTPAISAYAIETKGATGITFRPLSIYFDSADFNTATQSIKEKQIISNDRAIVIVTNPLQCNFIFKPAHS